MKKFLALILAAVMALSLAACDAGAPIDTTPTDSEPTDHHTEGTEQAESIQLVKSYAHTFSGNTYTLLGSELGSYQMNFSYADDLSGGSVTLTCDELDASTHGNFTCDDAGNITSMRFPWEDDRMLQFDITFDSHGRMNFAGIYFLKGSEKYLHFSQEITYDYHAGGKIASSTIARNGGSSVNTTQNTYDDRGNLTEAVVAMYEQDAVLFKTRTVYVYKDGYLSTVEQYDQNNALVGSVAVEHTTENGCNLYTATDGDSKITMIIDAQGRVLLNETTVAGKVISRTENKYNEAGAILVSEITSSSVTDRQLYSYDEHGNPTGYTHYQNDKLVTTNTITYITVTP